MKVYLSAVAAIHCILFTHAFVNTIHTKSPSPSPTCINNRKSNSNLCMSSLTEDLEKACSATDVEKLDCDPIFRTFAKSEEFKSKYWQKEPYLCESNLQNLDMAFTMADVEHAVETDFLEAGRGTFNEKSGWNMATVSEPKGSSFEDAKLKYNEVTRAMKEKSGTVVFNSAGGFVPKLAGVCLQCVNQFEFPCALNMYLTDAGQQTSAPPHTDKQDVFVMQTQGQKHWRVFAPPPPSRMPRADPLARGKGMDQLSMSELGNPLIDTILSPGNILYIPAGYPHTTDTIQGISEDGDPSVHLTIGIDTHIWGLNYAALRENILKKAGVKDKTLLPKLETDLFWNVQSTLPLGFLGNEGDSVNDEKISTQILEKMGLVDAKQVTDLDKSIVMECVSKLKQHYSEMTDLCGRMYADVCMKISPAQMDLSFFRSRPYFQELDQKMGDYLSWHAPAPGSSKEFKKARSLKKGGSKGGRPTPSTTKGFGAA